MRRVALEILQADHRRTEVIAEVKVLGARGLGVKVARWCLTIRDPQTKETWYRPFWYKKDAILVANEPCLRGHSLDAILGHYGTRYFVRLET